MILRVISELVPSALALLAFFELVFPKVGSRRKCWCKGDALASV
jgi:hypothetical protein